MKNTTTTRQPQGLSRRFWLSVLITPMPGQALSFHAAEKGGGDVIPPVEQKLSSAFSLNCNISSRPVPANNKKGYEPRIEERALLTQPPSPIFDHAFI